MSVLACTESRCEIEVAKGTGNPVSSDAYKWATLAVASLVVAGLLSLFVVIGRLPVISRWIDDPLFFKRCLVTHVNLSLTVWFGSFIAALCALRHRASSGPLGQFGIWAGIAGAAAIVAGSLARGAQPVLSNYVPVIDHPLFLGGLGLFFAGLLAYLIQSLLRSDPADGPAPIEAGIGLQASAVAFVVAAVTFVGARASLSPGMEVTSYYELLFWGPGHVLQVANVAAMVALWLWLLRRATGAPVVSPRVAGILFAALALPHFAMPLLTARGVTDALYTHGATQLMRWGIFPVVSIFFLLGLRGWLRRRKALQQDRGFKSKALLMAFGSSAGLTILGFLLGACIRSSNTLVPAHYHASLGGVTVAFMAGFYLLAEAAGARSLVPRFWKAARWQLAIYGVGQAVFALGFGLGGVYGLGRKAYASEQHIGGIGPHVALIVMGIGGLVAVVGGVWFLALAIGRLKVGLRQPSLPSLDEFSGNETQCIR